MANGRLAAVDLTATTTTTVYTVPVGKTAAFTIRLANRNAGTANVRLAVAATASPTAEEWLDYDSPVPGYGILDETGLVLDAGKLVVARSDSNNVNVLIWGYEDDAV